MKEKKLWMSKQIRLKCLDCSGGTENEVKFCAVPDCPLWLLRMGCYPKTYIGQNGKQSAILFDPHQFEEDGLFYGAHQSAEEAKKAYIVHCARG